MPGQLLKVIGVVGLMLGLGQHIHAKDIIVGTPPWQYKFATDSMLVLPSAIDMSKTQANMRGHALTLDPKREDFYFEYVVKQAVQWCSFWACRIEVAWGLRTPALA
jgi:hypothetical protein